ncbi:tagaturonate reductase [Clostridium cellulovorans]|uniref:Mannitol dehydrogenase domain n=1 Tax=Clostridium cellulovorans (strain ATCC 35296 / DSM 3052 / OCM 3 / 743B) TaxID=573061 RepID=D9SP25_CLOC7|nr:tagaturonate reductase [Clostridium cellulovorans]ADL51990.1 Mannitol dehydrogenase domain [Clostridium cellulovorans 743B]
MLKKLSVECLNEKQRSIYDKVVKSPIKVMQIGEGNFLTSFFDWMLYKAIEAGKYEGSVALTCPLDFDKKINILKEQDMLYTVTQRGFKDNVEVDESDIISVFSKVFNYNVDWNSFMEIAELESLEVIISNTTEAGLAYKEVELDKVSVDGLYPGKLTAFLMHRFENIKDKTKKLLIFPCELLDDNGKVLEEMVKKHAESFGTSDEFKTWVNESCVFLNNLVDRIVPGFPRENTEAYFEKLGYIDEAASVCEPFFLWGIEGSEEYDKILPLKSAGLNVKWADSLYDIHLLKVSILNGSHTLITPLGILKGFERVDELVEDPEEKAFLNEALQNEIIPSLKNEDAEGYAKTILQRFRNPHLKHKLESISMNSVSKFVNRDLPTVKAYIEDNNSLPKNMVIGLAGLLRFYQIEKKEDKYIGHNFKGKEYPVFDVINVLDFMCNMNKEYSIKNQNYVKAILSNTELWGEDLTKIEGLTVAVSEALESLERKYA